MECPFKGFFPLLSLVALFPNKLVVTDAILIPPEVDDRLEEGAVPLLMLAMLELLVLVGWENMTLRPDPCFNKHDFLTNSSIIAAWLVMICTDANEVKHSANKMTPRCNQPFSYIKLSKNNQMSYCQLNTVNDLLTS